jgi:hypothetical protein
MGDHAEPFEPLRRRLKRLAFRAKALPLRALNWDMRLLVLSVLAIVTSFGQQLAQFHVEHGDPRQHRGTVNASPRKRLSVFAGEAEAGVGRIAKFSGRARSLKKR